MYKICQTEQSFRRQRELEDGLLRLMQRRRYEDISVSDLCEYMQIPRKSFYRYFSSKDGALMALLDHTMADFFEGPSSWAGTGGSALGDLQHYFAFWYERKYLLDALQRNSLSGFLVERASAFAIREGHMPKQFKELRQDIQGVVLAFGVCGLMSMVLQWHTLGFPVPPEEMTRIAVSLLTKPLLPDR